MEAKVRKVYSYKGPVLVFGELRTSNFEALTYTESEKKARSNIAYQYKKRYDLVDTVKVTLPGKIQVVED